MYCTKCASEIPSESRFCPVCGQAGEADLIDHGAETVSPIPQESQNQEPQEIVLPKQLYAGFWSRLFALIIDTILLGLVGMVLCFALFEPLSNLGLYGRFIGETIAGLYFVLMLGKFNKGQTVGKMLTGIRVVNLEGKIASYSQLFSRFLILNVFFLDTILCLILLHSNNPRAFFLFSCFAVIPFIMYLVIYFLVIFHPEKRGLHDLLAGTIVVKSKYAPQTVRSVRSEMNEVESKAKLRKATLSTATSLLLAVGLAFGLTIYAKSMIKIMENTVSFSRQSLMTLRSEVNKIDDLVAYGINLNFSGNKVKYLSIVVRPSGEFGEDSEKLKKIYSLAKQYVDLQGDDYVNVVILKSADLGIANVNRNYPITKKASEI